MKDSVESITTSISVKKLLILEIFVLVCKAAEEAKKRKGDAKEDGSENEVGKASDNDAKENHGKDNEAGKAEGAEESAEAETKEKAKKKKKKAKSKKSKC